MSNIIYYFSGTGNSLAIARSIADKMTETEVVPITNLQTNGIIPSHYQRIGFVFPCFYSHLSPVVVDAVKNVQLSMHHKIFAIVTYGGVYGFALSDMKRLLKLHSGNVIQGFAVKMPGNHIVGYSAFSKEKQQKMLKDAQKKLSVIAGQIMHDIPAGIKEHGKLRILLWNYFVKITNRKLGIKDIYQKRPDFYVTDVCVHCGKCEKVCPVQNIQTFSTGVRFGPNCQQCMACIQWCPLKAIAHPNIPIERKHYQHPDITLNDMIHYNESSATIRSSMSVS